MGTITATELARSTRDVLDRVAAHGETVVIERNNVPIARIVPPERVTTAARLLARLRPLLEPAEGAQWLKDSRGRFDETVRDPWE